MLHAPGPESNRRARMPTAFGLVVLAHCLDTVGLGLALDALIDSGIDFAACLPDFLGAFMKRSGYPLPTRWQPKIQSVIPDGAPRRDEGVTSRDSQISRALCKRSPGWAH